MDLLRFFPQFGTEPFETIDGPRFFRIAARLPAYEGALAVAFRKLLQQQEAAAPPAGEAPSAPPSRGSSAPAQRAPARGAEQASGELHHGIRVPPGAQVVTLAEMALANPDLIGFQKVG